MMFGATVVKMNILFIEIFIKSLHVTTKNENRFSFFYFSDGKNGSKYPKRKRIKFNQILSLSPKGREFWEIRVLKLFF